MFGPIELAILGIVVLLLFSPKLISRRAKDLGDTAGECRRIGKQILDGDTDDD